MLLILKVVVVMNVQVIFQRVVVNVVHIFIIQQQIVSMLNNVQMLVLVNLVLFVRHRIQLAAAMEHIVLDEIVSLALVEEYRSYFV